MTLVTFVFGRELPEAAGLQILSGVAKMAYEKSLAVFGPVMRRIPALD